MYQIGTKRNSMASRDPPRTQFVWDVESIGESVVGEGCGEEVDKIMGPL